MERDPGRCEYLLPLPRHDGHDTYGCALVRRMLGATSADAGRTNLAACRECCTYRLPSTTRPNPVIASLVYTEARRIAEGPGSSWREREEAVRSQGYVVEHLEPRRTTTPVAPARPVSDALASASAPKPARAPRRGLGRLGLVGWNTATGVGYMNRDLATHLPIEKWLVPRHAIYPTLGLPRTRARIEMVPLGLEIAKLEDWMRGLDTVLFAELPYFPALTLCAREMGTRLACLPMWEFADLGADWARACDLMICPTRLTYDLMSEWKSRFDFGWDIVDFPWPIDTRRFRFRRRRRCERFLFVNGTGGCSAFRVDGSPSRYRRKGMDIVLAAARLLRPIPFLVFTQELPVWPVPENVELRRPPAHNESLYEEGDVCVQPSRWEGLGLQMLECQAAGLPLVTTDAPPMNECRPIRAVAARDTELVTILGRHALTSHNVDPEDLAANLEGLYRTDLAEASRAARSFIETEHCWERALPLLQRALAR